MTEVVNRDISLLNEVLDTVLKGDMTSRVDLSSISGEYRWIGEKMNEMIDVASKNIKESEELKELKEAMPDPLCIVDLNGIRIDCNPAMEEITGMRKEEFIGKPANIVFVEEERAECERALEEVIRTGHADHLERTILTKDGKKILYMPTSTREEMQMVIRSEQSLL